MEILTINERPKIHLLALVLLWLGGISAVLIAAYLIYAAIVMITAEAALPPSFGNFFLQQLFITVVVALLCGLLLVFDNYLFKKRKFATSILVSFILFMPIVYFVWETIDLFYFGNYRDASIQFSL